MHIPVMRQTSAERDAILDETGKLLHEWVSGAVVCEKRLRQLVRLVPAPLPDRPRLRRSLFPLSPFQGAQGVDQGVAPLVCVGNSFANASQFSVSRGIVNQRDVASLNH